MDILNKTFAIIFGTIAVIVIIALFFTLPTFLLWNWLMPIIFGLPELTFWQALGVTLLSSILFKSSSSSSK